MTTAVAVIGLTYDGTDVQFSDLSILLQITRGLAEPPSVRGVDTTVPALAGTVEQNRINHTISILLEGHVRADPTTTTTATARASYQAKRALVRALFATNRTRAALVATLEDGSTQTIMARPMNALWTVIIPSEFATVSIELEGYDDWA